MADTGGHGCDSPWSTPAQPKIWPGPRDWPFLRAPTRIDYGSLLGLFEQLLPDAEARQAVSWSTPRRLFGFGS